MSREGNSPRRPLRPCRRPGCPELVEAPGYCEKHKSGAEREYDQRRGTAAERGYNWRWQKYRLWFLKQAGNQVCYLRGPRCKTIAELPEHINPPDGPNDPKFWDTDNHAPSCGRCNSWKGNRTLEQLIRDEREYYKSIKYNPLEYLANLRGVKTS